MRPSAGKRRLCAVKRQETTNKAEGEGETGAPAKKGGLPFRWAENKDSDESDKTVIAAI